MADETIVPHPDIDISTLHEIIRQDGGIFLSDIPENFVATLETENSVYTLVVVDIEKGKVGVKGSGKHLETPEVCHLLNSTWSGPHGRTDWWLGYGTSIVARHALTKILTTTEISKITLTYDQTEVSALIEEAQKKKQRMLTEDECDEIIFVLLDNGFTAQL